jgi:copper chaperone
MTDVTLKIEGMSCQHCVKSVEKALLTMEGIRSAEIAVGSATMAYDESKTDRDAIVAAIQGEGYKVVG